MTEIDPMTSLRLTCLLLVLPAALAAQDPGLPADWVSRLDGEQRLVTTGDVSAGSWSWVTMPPGWHVTTTEQGVSLFPRDRTVDGRWGVEAELFLFKDPSDAPFGLVLQAADAPAGTMELRFLLRRDGTAGLVARHGGVDTTVVAWRGSPEVAAHPGDEIVKYVLRVTHEGGALAFAVNGHEMFQVPAGEEDHSAVPGLRLGAGLNVHVSRFDLIEPLAPPRAR